LCCFSPAPSPAAPLTLIFASAAVFILAAAAAGCCCCPCSSALLLRLQGLLQLLLEVIILRGEEGER
jgi:hypothetical protein